MIADRSSILVVRRDLADDESELRGGGEELRSLLVEDVTQHRGLQLPLPAVFSPDWRFGSAGGLAVVLGRRP